MVQGNTDKLAVHDIFQFNVSKGYLYFNKNHQIGCHNTTGPLKVNNPTVGGNMIVEGTSHFKGNVGVGRPPDNNCALISKSNGKKYSIYSQDGDLFSHKNINLNGTILQSDTEKSLTIRTNHGWLQIGPMNGNNCEINTDRPTFKFNKK